MVYLDGEKRYHMLVPTPTGQSWVTECLFLVLPGCMIYPLWQLIQEISKCEPQKVLGIPTCASSLCRLMGQPSELLKKHGHQEGSQNLPSQWQQEGSEQETERLIQHEQVEPWQHNPTKKATTSHPPTNIKMSPPIHENVAGARPSGFWTESHGRHLWGDSQADPRIVAMPSVVAGAGRHSIMLVFFLAWESQSSDTCWNVRSSDVLKMQFH